MATGAELYKKRKVSRREKDTPRAEMPAGIVRTLVAGGDYEDPAARLAYARADAWAHTLPGTPYGDVRVAIAEDVA